MLRRGRSARRRGLSGANEWITAYDTTTHAQAWQRNFYTWTNPNTLGTAASVSASRVYLTGLDSKLHILDVATGNDTIPAPNLGSAAQNTPVPAADKVFVGTNNGRVVAFNPATGAQLWATTLNTNGIVSSPVFAGSQGQELVFAASTSGSLYGLDAITGAATWQYTTGGPLFAPPAIVSNHILIGSDDHKLYGLVPGLPDNRSMAPPPPLSHTYGMRPDQQYSWDPVATSTGNYVYQATDLSLPGRGIPIGFARSYNSLDATTNGPLGYGWTFNAAASITPGAGTATIRWGDGHTDTYTGTGPTYTSPPDGHDTLAAATAGGWDLTTTSHLRYHFDPAGKLIAIVDSSGNQTTLTHDGSGRLATIADASAHTLTFGYDADHHLTTLTDADNNLVIDNTYDAQGRVTDQTDSAGGHWGYTYNTSTTVVTDPIGHAITYTFDTDHRTTGVTDALGNTSRWIYDDRSNLVATLGPTGRASQFHYDTAGNMTAALDPLGHKTAFTYDPANNLVAVTNLKGHAATFAYDAANRLTDTTTPAGVTSHVTYRPDGLVDTITDATGATTRYGYDANGMPLTVTDPLGHTVRHGYDNTGRTTGYTDQNNHTTAYAYDGRGLLTATTHPLGRVDRVGYDLARRPTSTTNARNQTITYGYDNADRLTGIDNPTGTPDTALTLDDAGRVLTTSDGTGTNTFTYDTGGRLASEHRDLANATLTYTYDMLNRRNRLALVRDGGLTARNTYTYDPDSRLSVLTDSAGGETHFDYDPTGRLETLANPNSVVAAYTYDAAGQVTGITNTRTATVSGTANLVSGYHYNYDAAGQRTSATRTIGGQPLLTNTYAYDPLGRLTAATSSDPQAPADANATWAYDNAGNRITQTIHGAVATTYTYDPADQLSSDGTRTYTWDADGNLTARRTSIGGQTLATYAWDPANRVTSQTAAGQTTSYTYDGGGRRVTKTDPTGTSTYLYDGGDLLEELTDAATGGDAVETTAGGTVLNRITATGTNYLHPDANANIGETTDQKGLTVARNAYAPWGGHNTITSSATDPYLNRHTYAGAAGVRDDNGGLVDMRNRMYDPGLGLFISRDLIENSTHEPYRYVGGNPISRLDPAGLDWWDPRDNVLPALGDGTEAVGGFVTDNRHTIIDIGTGALAATGTAACIASVACGLGAVAVGAGALIVGSTGAHIVADEWTGNPRGNPWEYAGRSTLAAGAGAACGWLVGQGCASAAGLLRPVFPVKEIALEIGLRGVLTRWAAIAGTKFTLSQLLGIGDTGRSQSGGFVK